MVVISSRGIKKYRKTRIGTEKPEIGKLENQFRLEKTKNWIP
jgi:hypothetical protein